VARCPSSSQSRARRVACWSPVLAQRAVSEEQEGSSQTILCARRTLTIKRCSFDTRSEGQSGCSPEDEVLKTSKPSPGQMARLDVPVGGRVRTLRAVGDQAGHLP
jgi:hypothetical protein